MSATGQTVLEQLRARASGLFHSGRFEEAAAAYSGILKIVPSDFDAIHHMGMVAIQLGHLEEARKLLTAALSINANRADVWMHHGMAMQHLKRTDDAVASYERALSIQPDLNEAIYCMAVTQKDAGRSQDALRSFNAFLNQRADQPIAFLFRGDLLRETGQIEAAMADFESALTLNPGFFEAWLRRGALLAETGRTEDALACYDKAEALLPNRGDVWYNRGVALQDLGRNAEALAAYDNAVKFSPDFPDAWNNRGAVLRNLERKEEALASFARALELQPRHMQSLNNQGAAFNDLQRYDEALASYDKALEVAPEHAEGWYNRGVALHNTGSNEAALAAYDESVARNPKFTQAWNNRGSVLRAEVRLEEAMGSFARALAIDPRHADTLSNAGSTLQDLKRYAEASREFRKLEAVAPDHKYLLGGLAYSALMLCDWAELESLRPRLEESVRSGKSVMPPFAFSGISSDPALLRVSAEHYIHDFLPVMPAQTRPAPYAHPKIRLAYVSNDFHAHATARLMADLFERHDRSRFEVIALSFGPDEKSDVRERLKKAFDQFHDVRKLQDGEAAALIRKLEADIVIDLKGYTEHARPGIFARTPAPVQVNYLGFPGTMGASFMDYVIADPVILPMDQQPFFCEQIVQLPDTYQPNDPARVIGKVPSRVQAGLPAEGFVFNSFNNSWKIAAPVFDVWMRLLEKVPGSVLWLLDDGANETLRRQAQARGIDPARLIFAPKLAHAEHLGRLCLADLVLDTQPYNAHTTASDALWCGVPMVTQLGTAFAGRVGASLLNAVGLPELVTSDSSAYEALALSLAQEPRKLQALKEKLAKNIKTAPLFDAARFCRNIEAAYIKMAEAAQSGEKPKAFAVPA